MSNLVKIQVPKKSHLNGICFDLSKHKFTLKNKECGLYEALEAMRSVLSNQKICEDIIGTQALGIIKISDYNFIVYDSCLEDGGPNGWKLFRTEMAAIKYQEDQKEYYNDFYA